MRSLDGVDLSSSSLSPRCNEIRYNRLTRLLYPSFILSFVLLTFILGILLSFRIHPFPTADRRLFWLPSVFLGGALVVVSASFGSSKFESFRTSALNPAFSWVKRRIIALRHDVYIVMLVAYLALLLVSYFRFGILFQFSLGMYALISLPLILVIGRGRLVFLKSWIPFLIVFLSYEALQGLVSVVVANSGIISLYAIDFPIWGFNLTGAVQAALYSNTMTYAMTFFYTLHLPLVVLASIYFWYTDKSVYRGYTYAVLITAYCALVTFLFFPTAPPWYEGAAKNLLQSVNTVVPVKVYTNVLNAIESDKFAAFPSLHGAFAIIFLYYMRKRGRLHGLLALPITAGILLSTIYLGQHYLIDLIGGAAYALPACYLVDWFATRSQKRAMERLALPTVNQPKTAL